MSSIDIIKKLIVDGVTPNHLRDTELLNKYIGKHKGNKEAYDPILLALGETWTRVPEQLVQYLKHSTADESGYLLSMYGQPEFRRQLKGYLEKSESWPDPLDYFEVAISWNGTRSSMFDYGQYVKEYFLKRNEKRQLVFISTAPDWDYEGVFAPQGYGAQKVKLLPSNQFVPKINDFYEAVRNVSLDTSKKLAFIVINSQHNPTGQNFSQELIEGIIELAIQEECGLLVDNAYFGYSGSEEKTSPNRIILEKWNNSKNMFKDLFFSVRSLGKQFNCNGWGLGAIVASPDVLDIIVNHYRTVHSYNYYGMLQQAMNKWLVAPESELYLKRLSEEHVEKKLFLQKFFQKHLKYPSEAFLIGDYAPYLLYKVPIYYQGIDNGIQCYIEDVFMSTGVLLTSCYAIPRNETHQGELFYIRMYTGIEIDKLREAMERLSLHGFQYG